MKFAFCGGLDCPEWLHAELATLSRLSSIRVRLLASQVAAHLATGNLSREALAKAAGGALTPRDVAACLAALRAVLAGSARHSVEAGVLAREMEQLGLPREHVEVLRRVYTKEQQRLREALLAATPRLARPPSGLGSLGRSRAALQDAWRLTGWHVDLALAAGDSGGDGEEGLASPPVAVLRLAEGVSGETLAVAAEAGMLRVLLQELRSAREALGESSRS